MIGKILMTNFKFHHDPAELPEFNESCHPVQMFDNVNVNQEKTSIIARTLLKTSIKSLGTYISEDALDFITIAAAVTSAETFENRKNSANSWARKLNLEIPLKNPEKWCAVAPKLSKTLNYLTGDIWSFSFIHGGLEPPVPTSSPKAKAKARSLIGLDSVCLFSGGLDSAVGALDLINGSSDFKPLLVSHAYKGDGQKQRQIEGALKPGGFSRLAYSFSPRIIKSLRGKTDITMRGRSFNFIAMAVAGLSAIRTVNENGAKTIFIPENGYISLNPPLTRRRTGSLSTRTTHPYFLSSLQDILNEVGFNIEFKNPYQFKTKGEMISECQDQDGIKRVTPYSVSCSNWHRKRIQCGRCVPCIIRRASIYKGKMPNDALYDKQDLTHVLRLKDTRDDLLALNMAILKVNNGEDVSAWVRQSGALPQNPAIRKKLNDVFKRGLLEVEQFLQAENVL
jgi:hypothetical protein